MNSIGCKTIFFVWKYWILNWENIMLHHLYNVNSMKAKHTIIYYDDDDADDDDGSINKNYIREYEIKN